MATREGATGVCLCGVATAEVDRSGRFEHHACTALVLATVARETHPYDDSTGVAAWLSGQRHAAGVAGW